LKWGRTGFDGDVEARTARRGAHGHVKMGKPATANDNALDIGTFVANAELFANDALVLRYGYVMQETTAVRTYAIDGILPIDGKVPSRVAMDYSYTRKIRRKATPYVFDVRFDNISPERWAILAALGMTRAPRKLLEILT
jgi:hypothetical protein